MEMFPFPISIITNNFFRMEENLTFKLLQTFRNNKLKLLSCCMWLACGSILCLLISLQSFLMRKQFFNDKENGYLKTEKPKSAQKNPMQGIFVETKSFLQIIYCSNLYVLFKFSLEYWIVLQILLKILTLATFLLSKAWSLLYVYLVC